MDFNGLGMKQVKGLTPSFSLRLLTFIQEAMPLRLKEVHFVNQPFLFNMVWTMFKPFVKEKLKNRMFFHGNKMESLHKHIDPAYLPEDYGGALPKINYSSVDWYPVLRTLDNEFKEWNSFGIVQKWRGNEVAISVPMAVAVYKYICSIVIHVTYFYHIHCNTKAISFWHMQFPSSIHIENHVLCRGFCSYWCTFRLYWVILGTLFSFLKHNAIVFT